MISFITKMTDRPVVATCPLGSSLPVTSLPGVSAVRPVSLAVLPIRERTARPTKAAAVAAAAQAQASAYASVAAATNGAGATGGNGQTQHHTMWPFRGLEPWSDPA
ncbi:hypothetical protein [Streptomyces sp. H27-D2]|uniref:hypothetical protein n=1 Tax=Streptomyces sp. H27-D2 TaxID=3046304 RepID=UPI002DC04C6E|nr:hypothetical protein [Streptomyces sp. H27-D2]MEC4018340.1 hypothetical protein [Streptomyces sp. H27-D2]